MNIRNAFGLVAALHLITGAALAAGPAGAPAVERGAQLFHTKGTDWSCASCHTDDPRQAGRHAVTGKPIEPMAPAVNPKRLTDPAKTEKWFRRNCKDVLGRECTASEKADVVAYLRSLGR
jgi:mono/diheme cytochrome c family protein